MYRHKLIPIYESNNSVWDKGLHGLYLFYWPCLPRRGYCVFRFTIEYIVA